MYGNNIGDMAWMDLSVTNADEVKGFYQQVLGWQSQSVSMTANGESYNDYAMNSVAPDKQAKEPSHEENHERKSEEKPEEKVSHAFVTGVCHAKGDNDDMPTAWLPYFLVAELDEAVVKVQALGGSLVTKIKSIGDDRFVVIKDPAGAMCALYQKKA